MLKLAAISSCGARATYLLRAVAKRFGPFPLLRVSGRTSRAARSRRARLAELASHPLDALLRREADAYRRWRGEAMERQVTRALYGGDEVPAVAVSASMTAAELDAPRASAWLDAQQPDLLIVISAPILKPSVYARATQAVNLHFGILPEYRGEHTLFWAMKNADWDHVGVTLHVLVEKVDRGPVLGRDYVALDAREDEATLLTKATIAGADLLVAYIEAANAHGLSPGVPQPPGGRQYYRRERTLLRDVELAAKRLVSGLAPIPRPRRRDRFF